MIFKKSIAILSTSSSLHNLPVHSQSFTSPCSGGRICPLQQRRHYAKPTSTEPLSDDDSSSASSNTLTWPSPAPPALIPTPYQILAQERSAPYTKRRYYELVKLYHPDRSSHDKHLHNNIYMLSPAVRLERYRLIVAAHEILSDPAKRGAYDACGAGWDGTPNIRSPWQRRRGSKIDDELFKSNGTWEDWERWRTRGDVPPQAPVYVSNIAFVALIAMFAALGGIGQATRAERNSMSFIEQRDLMHQQTSKELMRLRREARGQLKEERIEQFVRSRDAAMGVEKASEEQQVRKLLPDIQFCSSDDVARRPADFWGRGRRDKEE